MAGAPASEAFSAEAAFVAPRPSGQQVVSQHDDDVAQVALATENVLPRRIAAWAARDPDRPFLVEIGGRTASYGDVSRAIGRWAAWLRSLGVGSGDMVLSMLPASIDGYLLWMAASAVGACEVPINPELRGEFLEHALTDAGARLCFVRPEQAGVPLGASVDGLEIVIVDREGGPADDFAPIEVAWPAPADPACVIYTSGTTGPSKGAIVSWAQMGATIGRIPRSWFDEGDAVYCCHAMFHVTGRSPLPAMADVGGRVVLRERFSLGNFWNDVREHGCTSTTAFVALLLGLPPEEGDRDNPLRVVFGGHDGRQNRAFAERFGVHVLDLYGSTEAGFPIGLRWYRDDALGRRDCGFLRRGYEARIVDEKGRDTPDGEAGELWVRAPDRLLVTLGYLGRPEKTAEAFEGDWYRTGDAMIRHTDGSFEFVDRLRDTIRRMGENISSSALESAVLADAEVAECAALGVRDPVAGQEVLLVVCPEPGVELSPDALAKRLSERLPRYMAPAYISVMQAEELPRTPTRKIRKNALLEGVDIDRSWRAPDRRVERPT